MQWIIDLIKDWVQAQGYLTQSFIDRGDPAVVDYGIADFTKDGFWYDLDLSAIVPAGATAVLLRVQYTAFAVGRYVKFRENGNANNTNASNIYAQAANVELWNDCVIRLDSNRVIEYQFAAIQNKTCNTL